MRTPLWIVKLTNFEYWPWWVFYAPMIPYWLYQAVRAKSLAFFTAANPSIEAGGFYGEKKNEILAKIPTEYLPKTIFIHAQTPFTEMIDALEKAGVGFPMIAKPNVGERGNDVRKLDSADDLKQYHQNLFANDFIIQEFIEFSIELGVLFSRLPMQSEGMVSSVTMKEFLAVKGDGKSKVIDLILQSPRARFQLETLKKRMGADLERVLANGEKLLLEPIGNHCRGTKFVNANHLINDELHSVFARIANQYEGFNYGRFDMKVKSLDDLYAGKNIRIMELNGVSSDPGHIYDPNYSLYNAYKDLAWHWQRIANISIANQKLNHQPLSFKELRSIVKQHFFSSSNG